MYGLSLKDCTGRRKSAYQRERALTDLSDRPMVGHKAQTVAVEPKYSSVVAVAEPGCARRYFREDTGRLCR